MKALVYRAPERVEVVEAPKPRIEKPTDAILRVTTAAICGSDLHVYHGLLSAVDGLILGHEFVGVVDEVGAAVEGLAVGQRVFVEAGLRCGVCEPCKLQLPFCPNGGIFGFSGPFGTLQGGQAEFVRVPFAQRIMHPMADNLADEDVILLTDNMVTGYSAAEWGNIQPGDTVVVYGCGVVGLCAQAAARLFGAGRVFAVDRLPYRLEMAKRVGSIPIDASSEDPPTRVRQETGLIGAPVVIEAVGARATLEMAFQSVQPQGTVSTVGVFTEDVTLPMSVFSVAGVTFRSGLASPQSLPRLLTMVEKGTLDLRFVFTHTLPLSEGARAYRLFDKKEEQALKVLLKP
jgi:threonine dehydrogenase-like Zn-dependent dehydrogenase